MCVRARALGGGTTFSLSLSVSPGSWRGFLGAVDERVGGALPVKTRESSLGLRSPLCHSDQNGTPVSFYLLYIRLQIYLPKVRMSRRSIRGSGQRDLRSAPLCWCNYKQKVYRYINIYVSLFCRFWVVAVALAVERTRAVSLNSCGYRKISQIGDILLIFTFLDLHFNATPAAVEGDIFQESSSPACHSTQIFQIFPPLTI